MSRNRSRCLLAPHTTILAGRPGCVYRAIGRSGARALLTAALCASAALAQDPAVFKAETRLVEVSLLVTDGDGNPVTDLAADEIRVRDNGRDQQILSLQRTATRGDANRGARQWAYRHSIVLIDAVNTDISDRTRAGKALEEVFGDLDAEEERIAVFLFSDKLILLHDFLDSPSALREMAKSLTGNLVSQPSRWQGTAGPSWSRLFDDGDRQFDGLRDGYARQLRALSTLQAFIDVADGTSHIRGQKNLIWISSGFPVRSPMYYADWSFNEPSGYSSRHNAPLRLTQDGYVSTQDINRAMRRLNASNTSLYPVNARGLTIDPAGYRNIDAMESMARKTGGQAYHSRNAMSELVNAAIRDSRDGYVLSYDPGAFNDSKPRHRINIATTRKNIHLRYRRTYDASSNNAARP